MTVHVVTATENRLNASPLLAIAFLALLSQTACAQRDEAAEKPLPGQIPLINAGFEEAGGADNIPGWHTAQHAGEKSYEMTVDAKGAAKGKQSFRLTQVHEQFFGMIGQTVPATSDMAGKIVELSAMMKTSKVGPRGWGLFLNVHDALDAVTATYESTPIIGDNGWTRVTVRGVIPPRPLRLEVGIQLGDDGNGGTGWADDVQLRVYTPEPAAVPAKP